jgi:hypothetical protein
VAELLVLAGRAHVEHERAIGGDEPLRFCVIDGGEAGHGS